MELLQPMDRATTLLDVSEALRRQVTAANILQEDQIFFNAPNEQPAKTKPYLLIYLYQTIENEFLRNYDPPPAYLTEEGRVRAFAELEFPPVALDLHYMMIPYGNDPAREIILTAALKRLFRDRSVVPPEYLPPAMQDTQIRAVAQNLDLAAMHQLWALFPQTNYKLSLYYILTPVVLPSDEPYALSRNVQTDMTYYEIPRGGRSK